MPVYEYKCCACGHSFEQRLSFSDNGHSSCPVCGAQARRVFIPVPIIFKGPGFYVTDNRKPEKSVTDEEKSEKKSSAPSAC